MSATTGASAKAERRSPYQANSMSNDETMADPYNAPLKDVIQRNNLHEAANKATHRARHGLAPAASAKSTREELKPECK